MLQSSTRLFLTITNSLVQSYYNGLNMTAQDLTVNHKINPQALMPALQTLTALAQALQALTQAGILTQCLSDTHPNYIFAKNPKQISMFELLTALEGNIERYHYDNFTAETDLHNCIIYRAFLDKLVATTSTARVICNLKQITLYQHSQLPTSLFQRNDCTIVKHFDEQTSLEQFSLCLSIEN